MILKKPYAFLIKHFKLIHIILALPLIYIVNKTRLVVSFFNQYVSNRYSFQTGSDISGIYVSGLMLFSIVIIIIAALTIYFLLKYKEKPVKMYVSLITYYIILFVVLYWLSSVISSMSLNVLGAKAARSYRDIATLIYYPQYIFIVFVILRAVGFNIKQFNFRSDLKELEITSSDNEEVEVGFEIDGYKTKRFFRRFKREFGYYLVENKFMVTVVVIIFAFSSLIIYYNTRKSYDISYSQTDSFVHQGFSLNVKDSIISNLSYNGSKINNDYYYLALKLNVTNNMTRKARLDHYAFVLNVGNKELKPILDKSTYFKDFASPYYNEFIKPKVNRDYTLVYQIDKKDIKKDFKLKVLSSFTVKEDHIVTKYALVNLSPVIIDELTDIKTSPINTKVNLANTNVGDSILTIKDYYIGSNYIYNVGDCTNSNNCIKDIVNVNYNIAKKESSLLVLGYDFDLDQETAYAKYIKSDNSFFEDFASVKVGSDSESEGYSVVDITPKNLKDKIVLQVDGNIINEDKVDLFITIRNKRYTINIR